MSLCCSARFAFHIYFVAIFNPYSCQCFLLIPLKTSEKLWFSDVFRGIKREHWHEKVNAWCPLKGHTYLRSQIYNLLSATVLFKYVWPFYGHQVIGVKPFHLFSSFLKWTLYGNSWIGIWWAVFLGEYCLSLYIRLAEFDWEIVLA